MAIDPQMKPFIMTVIKAVRLADAGMFPVREVEEIRRWLQQNAEECLIADMEDTDHDQGYDEYKEKRAGLFPEIDLSFLDVVKRGGK